ncbi:MAG: tetratricopeptide repeat protein, partial [Bacteroidia bacterium]
MNRYLKHIILALLLAYSVCFSQGKIDSLISRIEKANVDTVKAKLLTQLSWSYILTGNYDEALSTANKAFELSKNWKTGQAIATVDIAYVHIYRGELKEALNYFFKAYSLDSALGHKGEMAKELGGIGGVYSNMSDYPRSLRYYLEGLKLALALNDKVSVAKFQSNIGVVYVQQKDNLKALDYLTKAIKGFEETNNEIDRASAIGNKGIVYENLGQHAKAISCFKDALKTAEETGDKYRMTLWCENMGVALEGLGDSLILIKQATRIKNPMYEKAYGSYTKALDIAIETDDKMGMAIDNGFLGVLCTKYEKFKEAENFLLKARALADTSGSLELIAEQLKNLSNLYTQTGRAKQALEVYKQYILFKDSVFNEDNTKKQTQLEMQYEFDKKEAA